MIEVACIKYLKNIFTASVCIFIIYCLIFKFNEVHNEISSALYIWLTVIIPSVFPYLVLSNYITGLDIMNIFEYFPGKILCRLLKLNAGSTRAVICSLFCGYPSGAVCAVKLLEEKRISETEANRIICFTNNAGPLFLISAVGIVMMGSAKDGLAIYIIQLVSAFIYALFTGTGLKPPSCIALSDLGQNGDLCSAISKSVVNIVNICGFMICAYIMSGCIIIFLKSFNINAAIISKLEALVKGLFEISAGARAMAGPHATPAQFGAVCGFVSWSGISVIMQIKSIAKNIISTKKLVIAKLTQAMLSFLIGYTYRLICSSEIIKFDSVALKSSLITTILVYILFSAKRKTL